MRRGALLRAHGRTVERARRKVAPGRPFGRDVQGDDATNQYQSVPLRLGHGDLFILVSDGVSDGLDDNWVRELLREHGGEGPKELAARLVPEAKGRGSDDDRTAIVMRVEKTQL